MRDIAKSILALTVLSGLLLCASAAWAQSNPQPSPGANVNLDRDCYYWVDSRVPGAECWTRCPLGTEVAHVQRRAKYRRYSGAELARGRLYICRARVSRYAGRRCYAGTEYEERTPVSTGSGQSYRVLAEDVVCRRDTFRSPKGLENVK